MVLDAGGTALWWAVVIGHAPGDARHPAAAPTGRRNTIRCSRVLSSGAAVTPVTPWRPQ
jgi:hypothetical protein